MSQMRRLFRRFWANLPAPWKEGLCHALRGGCWRGDLHPHGTQEPSVVVYFVNARHAHLVDAVLEGQGFRDN